MVRAHRLDADARIGVVQRGGDDGLGGGAVAVRAEDHLAAHAPVRVLQQAERGILAELVGVHERGGGGPPDPGGGRRGGVAGRQGERGQRERCGGEGRREGVPDRRAAREGLDSARDAEPRGEVAVVGQREELRHGAGEGGGRLGAALGCRQGEAAHVRGDGAEGRRVGDLRNARGEEPGHVAGIPPEDGLRQGGGRGAAHRGVGVAEQGRDLTVPGWILQPPEGPYRGGADAGVAALEVRTHALQSDVAARVLLGDDLGVDEVEVSGWPRLAGGGGEDGESG